jgi:cation:H+ antiporter
VYTLRLTKAPAEEPHLIGPSLWLGSLSTLVRRITISALAAWSGIVILLCAEPFAHALVETGLEHGISEFFLVQWLAPLASEAPEFVIAGLFAWRLQTGTALGTLVSSKVNQWTLLVGSLPIVFAISSASRHGLPIAGTQAGELLLTAAQSLFAVAMLVNLRMSLAEAGWIFGLFWMQFLASVLGGERFHDEVLIVTSVIYLVAGVVLLWRHRAEARRLVHDGFRTPYPDLAAAD